MQLKQFDSWKTLNSLGKVQTYFSDLTEPSCISVVCKKMIKALIYSRPGHMI